MGSIYRGLGTPCQFEYPRTYMYSPVHFFCRVKPPGSLVTSHWPGTRVSWLPIWTSLQWSLHLCWLCWLLDLSLASTAPCTIGITVATMTTVSYQWYDDIALSMTGYVTVIAHNYCCVPHTSCAVNFCLPPQITGIVTRGSSLIIIEHCSFNWHFRFFIVCVVYCRCYTPVQPFIDFQTSPV